MKVGASSTSAPRNAARALFPPAGALARAVALGAVDPGAGTLVLLLAGSVLAQQKATITGVPDIAFTSVPNFLKLPPGETLGESVAVAPGPVPAYSIAAHAPAPPKPMMTISVWCCFMFFVMSLNEQITKRDPSLWHGPEPRL